MVYCTQDDLLKLAADCEGLDQVLDRAFDLGALI